MSHVLLINLGSPTSTSVQNIRKFLKEFLSDDAVIDLPKPLQQIILRAFILPFRPSRTKKAYEQIWAAEGSPLVANTRKIASALHTQTGWKVHVAMRYQQPSIRKAVQQLRTQNVTEVVVVSLYPHYATATIGTTRDAVERIIAEEYPSLKASFVRPFFNHPAYIGALASSIQPQINAAIDLLVFSYHGLPERHLRKTDPTGHHCLTTENCCNVDCDAANTCYRAHALKTSALVAKQLKLAEDKWAVTFQSRVSLVGPKWLRPHTLQEFKRYPSTGIHNVVVACPSFTADCLETLYEINILGREAYETAGGTFFRWVPALNDSPEFIDCLEAIVREAAFCSHQMGIDPRRNHSSST